MIIIYYIKELYNEDEVFLENHNFPKLFKKIYIKILQILNIIIIKENVILLPYLSKNKSKIDNKKLYKIFKKINKFLKNENINTVAISNFLNNLENINILKNNFYSNNYNILNGRWLFKHLSFEILEYISKESNKQINDLEISILTNSSNTFIIDNIKLLSQNVKNLSIVTSNLEIFKPIAEELYNGFGISIIISNNKKKVLNKSNVIFNFDFPEEVLNKYSLPLNGIIINYNNKMIIKNKLFNGLNINFYTINVHKDIIEDFKKINLLNSFPLEILYESIYFNKNLTYHNLISKFINDNLIITSLIGNNGKILKNEYKI